MHRRVLLWGVAALLVTPCPTAAQQKGRVPRVGCLSASSEATGRGPFDAFRQRLRELSYVEGQTVALEYRWAEGRYDRLDALARELARVPVDVIFATSIPATNAAKTVSPSTPIVMRITADPIAMGFARSLARPGGNVTGVADFASPSGKHLEILRQVLPGIKRVAVLHNPAGAQTASQMKEVREFGRALGLDLYEVEVRTPEAIDVAFGAIVKSGVRALTMLSDGLFNIHLKRIAELAAKNKLVTAYPRREFVDAGGLISYGSSLSDQYRLAANFVDKILKGAKPADLPIEQTTKFEVIVNMKTAKAIGVTIPPSLLLRADQVIE